MKDSDIIKLPKIDLHCHLDGSLRAISVLEELKKIDKNYSIENTISLKKVQSSKEDILSANKLSEIDNIQKKLTVGDDCSSLDDYLKCFDLPISVMQTKDAIRRFTYEVFEDAYLENIVYLELRFAPILHTKEGLTQEEVIESCILGMNDAKANFGIYGNIILCCMKHLSDESAISTIHAGRNFLGKGVVGIDLAGSEDEGFSSRYVNSMKIAQKFGYKITIHAGEAASGKNVYEAITKLNADRIGHGIRIFDDQKAYNLVREKNILLEICPTSNIDTKAVTSMDTHPIFDYYNNGINISINTDNRTVSNTTMTKELSIFNSFVDFDIKSYKNLYYNIVNASFTSDDIKENLRNIMHAYKCE